TGLLAAGLSTSTVQADPVPDGGALTTGLGYDANGNLTTVNLPKGTGQTTARTANNGYDSLGRRINSTLAAPAAGASAPVIKFGYDGLDQLTSVTDPRSKVTTYTVNGLGNTNPQVSPDTGTTGFTYFADGRVQTRTDALGNVATYAYDDLGRLTAISYTSGIPSQFYYDGSTASVPSTTANNSTGQLSSLVDESGTTVYTHDGFGRVLSKTQTVATSPSRSFVLSQTWSSDAGSSLGKLKSLTLPSKATVNFTYLADGRLKAIAFNPVKTDGTGTDTTRNVSVLNMLKYNGLNDVQGWTWGDNTAYSRTYDSNGRLKSYYLGNPAGTGTTAGLIRTLSYDDAGRISGYTHTNSAGTAQPAYDQTFTYDGLDRLKQQQQSSSTNGFDYDLSNNRTTQTIGGVTYTNTIAAANNRVSVETGPNGTTNFTYYATGQVKADGTNTFTYSPRGRMASVKIGTDTVSYLYNGLEQRVAKTGPTTRVDSGARYYAYDEQGHLIGEYDASGNPLYEVIYLGDTPVGLITQTRTTTNGVLSVQTKLSYIYADHLDTPRVVTRASDHAIQWRWDQAEAFGNSAPNENPSALGAFTLNLRFPGQTFDKETGLFYNLNRDYRATLGRYIESDPIGLAGGINTYAYANVSPIYIGDATGLRGGDHPGVSECIARGNNPVACEQSAPNVSPPTPRPPVKKIWDPCEVEQVLGGMRTESLIDIWKNHSGAKKYDFAYNDQRFDRFHTIDGHDYNPHMFGNYAVGYAAYRNSGLFGVGLAMTAGIGYDVLQHGWNTDLDASSRRFIRQGATRAMAEMNGTWPLSSDSACACRQ
ncbi:RHS repeat-associated core domain-containing protein, partial [Ideonella azotifigens]